MAKEFFVAKALICVMSHFKYVFLIYNYKTKIELLWKDVNFILVWVC